VAHIHEILVAGLKESRRVEDVDLGPEDLAQEYRASANRQMRLADGLFSIEERRPAAEGRAEERTNLPIAS